MTERKDYAMKANEVVWPTGMSDQDPAARERPLVFNPQGDMEVRQTYEYAGSRPRLQWSEKGEIEVKGGNRRISPNDLPPESEQTSNVETNKTN